jgi:hypothetical protein
LQYDPQSPQKCLLLVFPDSDLSTHTFVFPATSMSVVGVGKFSANLLAVRRGRKQIVNEDAHSDPLEARQLRQWQSDAVVGNNAAAMDTVMAPQLQAPTILSGADAILWNI